MFIPIAAGVAALWWVRRTRRNKRTPVREISSRAEVASEAVESLLETVCEDPREFLREPTDRFLRAGEETELLVLRPGAFMRFVVATALLIKAEYGLLEATQANKMMVTHVAKKLLTQRNTRKCDISRALPAIVVVVFTPTRNDIEAREMMFGKSLSRALVRQGAQYERRGFWKWITKWWTEPEESLRFAK